MHISGDMRKVTKSARATMVTVATIATMATMKTWRKTDGLRSAFMTNHAVEVSTCTR